MVASGVSDVASVIAVPVGAAADGAVVFHGEEHDHGVAATGPAATSTSERGALIGANHGAVGFKDLDGIVGHSVDFQGRLGADVTCGVAGATTCPDVRASSDLELVVVAVEALLGGA